MPVLTTSSQFGSSSTPVNPRPNNTIINSSQFGSSSTPVNPRQQNQTVVNSSQFGSSSTPQQAPNATINPGDGRFASWGSQSTPVGDTTNLSHDVRAPAVRVTPPEDRLLSSPARNRSGDNV